jgi:ribosomal protein S18 acetylase RimI-like enzyme
VIRRATADDVDAIAELHERSFGTLTFLPVLHTLEEHRAHFARVVADQEAWVSEVGGSILGYAAADDAMLNYLYVEPEAIGRGVGSALYRHVLERRPAGLTFWVFQQNVRARRFYERHGARPIRFTDGAGNEEKTPDVLYEAFPESAAPDASPAPTGAA